MRILLFISFLFIALTMGLLFAHALESFPKMHYDGPLYITLQQTLYRWFGIPGGALLEVGAILFTAWSMVAYRQQKKMFYYLLITTIWLVIAIVLYFIFTEPVNGVFRSSSALSPPSDWIQLRKQWEYSHIVRFGFYLLAFSTSLAGILADRKR